MMDSWSVHLSPSISSASSSTRYSHLSVLTSSSSLSSAAGPSPLPSPSASVSSIGNKTHAFFASPFSDFPTPAPPPNPSRSSSLASRTSHASGSDESPSDAESDAKPRGPRSLNTDFFDPAPVSTLPRIRSVSRESPPASAKSLPPLSRFFPSRQRYNTSDSGPQSPEPFGARRFLDIDTAPPPAYPAVPPYSASPSYSSSPSDEPVPLPGAPASTVSSTTSLPTPVPRHEAASYLATRPDPAPAPPELEKETALAPGQTLGDGTLELELVRELGHGAFSSVWLARDVRGGLGPLELSRRTSLQRSRSERRGRMMKVDGTRPVRAGGVPMRREGCEIRKGEPPGERGAPAGRLVAVKMTERALCDKSTRSRVSFVREVEILRHISHPSIVPFVHAFSTSSRHYLVLAHASGGELFELVSSPARHAHLRAPLLRRLFGELCKAVAWMHGVGLVHRDIKLENILLTADPLNPPPLPVPLVQLGDFGLARFIDPADPLLQTLCGSESYAAPELAMARAYDGRATDAWACGVVLYALATRRLPFDRPREGMSREADETEGPGPPQPMPQGAETPRAERRAMLLRIAKAEFSWPRDRDEPLELEGVDVQENDGDEDVDAGLAGLTLARSAGVRRVVGRLLVRDPLQRAAVAELWEDAWMHGRGAPSAPGTSPAPSTDGHVDSVSAEDPDEDENEGVLVDGDDIGPGSVARQEH